MNNVDDSASKLDSSKAVLYMKAKKESIEWLRLSESYAEGPGV